MLKQPVTGFLYPMGKVVSYCVAWLSLDRLKQNSQIYSEGYFNGTKIKLRIHQVLLLITGPGFKIGCNGRLNGSTNKMQEDLWH